MTALADDIAAIQALKARYCLAVDRAAGDTEGARADLAAVFASDVVADYAGAPLPGHRAVADFLCTAIAGSSEWMLHMLHSPLIVVDGDGATGDWTVMVHLKRRAGGQVDVVIGRYSDRMRRTAEGWRIEHVRFSQLA